MDITPKGGDYAFLHKTTPENMLGRWQLPNEDEANQPGKLPNASTIDITRCGQKLCAVSVSASNECLKTILTVTDTHKPSVTGPDEEWARFIGQLDWIDGVRYDVLVDVDESDQYAPRGHLILMGGPAAANGDYGQRGYPLGLTFDYKGAAVCRSPTS